MREVEKNTADATDINSPDTLKDDYKSDDTFNDPSAEIVLVSKDKVRFRVHAWHLVQRSSFIGDMFAVVDSASRTDDDPPRKKARVKTTTGPGLDKAPPPIELDHHSSVVRTYVCLLYSAKSQSFPFNLKVQQWLQLLDLCNHMQSPQWRNTIVDRIKELYDTEPWEVLKYAANNNDIDLARKAIQYSHRQPGTPVYRYPNARWEEFSGLPVEWTYELFRVLYIYKDQGLPFEIYRRAAEVFFKDRGPTKAA